MIQPGTILGIARAEARLCRRLVRYWVFVVLAGFAGLVMPGYAYYAGLHWFSSAYSATAAMLNPRFFVGVVGLYYLMLFLLGLVFLGFDVRARDTRERMDEVLDTRPCSNIELLLGKFTGIMIACWIPVAIILLIIIVGGMAFKEPLEPVSAISLLFAMAIPAFSFMLGLVFLATLLLRHRFLAFLVLAAAIVGLYFAVFVTPIYFTPLVDVMGAYTIIFPSDITPGVVDLEGLLQRTGVFLAGLAFVWLAAAVHPRRDDSSRARRAATGLLMLVVAVGLCWGLALRRKAALDTKKTWTEVHEARRDDPAPDLLRLSGSLRIEPGRELAMDLDLGFRAPDGRALDGALFSLNPGLRVEQVADSSGRALEFVQENGLVDVRLPASLGPGEETSLSMSIRGTPDWSFAYLDSVIEVTEVNPYNGQLFLLGYEPFIFDRRYVALMPGCRWLPASGAEVGRGDPRTRPTDFYRLDLTVELPQGWLSAGPGRRHEIGSAPAGKVVYRYTPTAPVPDVALVAGRFESRSTEIDGVLLEALTHPSHVGNLDFFEDAAGEIRDWLADRLQDAADVGLAYPYDALTFVEIPNALRGYGGGWRMDSTMTQPAMLLTRESSFPTARFDAKFRKPEQFKDHEGGVPRAKREHLERFFENDFSGGNPFVGAARSFFGFQTAGSGPEGLPLDFVFESLSTKLVAGKQGYFSAHIYNQKDFNETINEVFGAYFGSQDGQRDFVDAVLDAVTSRVDIWDSVLGLSLSQLEPWDSPRRTLDVLTLKGGAMARSMLDGLGREKTGALLGTLRTSAMGESFDREDVLEAGRSVEEDLEEWLETWIAQTDLPGFTVGRVHLDRINDSDEGSSRYQLRVPLRNDESAPGMLRLAYRVGGDQDRWEQSDPVRVEGDSAVEIGLVLSDPPRSVRVAPYLSLNRGAFAVSLPNVDEEKIVDAEPFSGARQLDWEPPDDGAIVVDDLDPGFSVVQSARRRLWRLGGRSTDEATDQGLPVVKVERRPAQWSRRTDSGAWGKYRHTTAVVKKGRGEQRAIFSAEIPRSGQWELEYHLPRRLTLEVGSSSRGVKTLNLAIIDDSGTQELDFDGEGAEPGWNAVGAFELAGGEARVEVTDETDGRFVVADAIRWSPVGGAADSGATR